MHGRRDFVRLLALLTFPKAEWASAITGPSSRTIRASPSDYRRALAGLTSGETLALAPGNYVGGLPVHQLIGEASHPIVIEGPLPPAKAVFRGRPGAHTVSLLDCAHVIIRNLVLDGRGAAVDAVRAEGHARWAHHVTLERLTIVNHGATQQNSGISTKCPAWGWVVRGNTIIGAGTGMYFGDSDGSDPFFDSLIEANRIIDPVGYGIQVKHQNDRPDFGPAAESTGTVIRRNLIVKSRVAASPEMARPSLLVGHLPLSGPGARDRYLGVRIQPHNHLPREVAVFNNTIVAAALGIEFSGGEPGFERLFEHNLVYGNPPTHSEVHGENVTGAYDRARAAFARLDPDPSKLDMTPLLPLPRPRSRLGAEWTALSGAESDRRGRPQGGASFGACGRGGTSGGACR